MKNFEGTIFLQGIKAEQFIEAVAIKVFEMMKKEKEKGVFDDLANMVSRRQAATLFHYKDPNSMNQFHGKELNVHRKGKAIFYKKSEIIKLYKTKFHHH